MLRYSEASGWIARLGQCLRVPAPKMRRAVPALRAAFARRAGTARRFRASWACRGHVAPQHDRRIGCVYLPTICRSWWASTPTLLKHGSREQARCFGIPEHDSSLRQPIPSTSFLGQKPQAPITCSFSPRGRMM
jgi:hypothetical protein